MPEANYWHKRAQLMKSRRTFLQGTALAGAGLVLYGCGSSNNNNKNNAAANNSAAKSAASASAARTVAGAASPGAATRAAGSPAATAAAATGPATKPAGTINISVATLMEMSSSPFFQTGGLSTPIFLHAFEGFYRTGADGHPTPALASSLEQPDPQTIVFTLRPGTKFWDGSPVTMDDITWSYDAYVNQTTPPAPVSLILKGGIASVAATDATHVTVKFNKPEPFQMEEYGVPGAPRGWPVASHAYYNKVGADTFKVTPMCTGPYQITKNTVGQFLEMQANENYYDPARVPHVKTVRLNIVPDQQTRLAQIQNGEADIIEGIIGPAADTLKNASGIAIVKTANTAQLTVRFLDAAPPTGQPTGVQKDPRFRQALTISVDQDSIAKNLLKLGTPSPNVLIFPNSTGFDPSQITVPKLDTNMAKSLIKQAGVDATEIPLYAYQSSSYPLIPDVIQAYAGFWKDIGVNTKIMQQESGSYFTAFQAHSLHGLGAISFPNFSSGALLLVGYYKTGTPYGTTNNIPELEAIITQLSTEFDQNKQLDLVKQGLKLAQDSYYFVSAPYVDSLWATGKKIKDWSRVAGIPYVNGLETVTLTS
jgi:peptide/nickel transport system substrate-binding protein